MNIVRAEQSMRGWIVRASPGVLFCSTCCCLSLSCLTTVRRCPQIFSNASCFSLGTDLRGIRSIVFRLAMALLALSPPPGAEVEAHPRPLEKCNPHQRWKTALTIALLRTAKSFWTISPHTPTTPPTNLTSMPEIVMLTLPMNWKITSHRTNYAPFSATQEMLTRLIPLLPPSHLLADVREGAGE